jgi:hypothetical protein
VLLQISKAPLAKPTDTRPVYVNNDDKIIAYGSTGILATVDCTYIKKPSKVEWVYRIVYGESLYDATNTVDFELHPSEETELVFAILKLGGLILEDPSVYEIGSKEEQINTSQEKA